MSDSLLMFQFSETSSLTAVVGDAVHDGGQPQEAGGRGRLTGS